MLPVSMVGRSAELAELRGLWTGRWTGQRTVRGAPRAAVITGAAGTGKSLLVTQALAGFEPEPATVLAGQARVHSPAPYDWLAAVLCGQDLHRLPVPADALAWLAQHPDSPERRFAPGALLRLAVRTVRALVGTGPAVLVVEDLHALDPASLNLVAELALVADLPAALLVTSRPPQDSVSPDLTASTLARLAGAPGAVRQHLGPLRPAEVARVLAEVAGGPVPGELVRQAHARTGGNPYRLTELLASGAYHLPGLLGLGHPDPAAELTARERDVLSCLAAGMSNKQVARSLGISIRTVTVHVSNLLRKTGSSSRTEAALWAVRGDPVSAARRAS